MQFLVPLDSYSSFTHNLYKKSIVLCCDIKVETLYDFVVV